MAEIQSESISWGPLLLKTKIKSEIIDTLKSKGQNNRGKSELNAEKFLAASMHDEWGYTRQDLEWFISVFDPYVKHYISKLNNHIDTEVKIEAWGMMGLWINYQKANDFNPIHNHTGDLSFIIYLDVPEVLKTERKRLNYTGTGVEHGSVMFMYGEHNPPFYESRKYYFPQAGDLFMFPSNLMHSVIPFRTPDLERISVAGNIALK